MALQLKSTSNGGSKIEYSEAERNLAHICVSVALVFAEFKVPSPKLDPLVEAKLEEIKSEHTGVDTLCRALYRGFIRDMCGSGKEFKPTASFPKERDPTSVQLLMRVGMERAGRKDLVDQVFARYGAKKSA